MSINRELNFAQERNISLERNKSSLKELQRRLKKKTVARQRTIELEINEFLLKEFQRRWRKIKCRPTKNNVARRI